MRLTERGYFVFGILGTIMLTIFILNFAGILAQVSLLWGSL